jgi:hypothetical protein
MRTYVVIVAWLICCSVMAWQALMAAPRFGSIPPVEAAALRGGAECEAPNGSNACSLCVNNRRCDSSGYFYVCAPLSGGAACLDCSTTPPISCGGTELTYTQNCSIFIEEGDDCTMQKNEGSATSCSGSCF